MILRIRRCRKSLEGEEAEVNGNVSHDGLTEKIYEQDWLISVCRSFFNNCHQVHQAFIECCTFKLIVSVTFEKLWRKKWIFYTLGDTVPTGLDGTRGIVKSYIKWTTLDAAGTQSRKWLRKLPCLSLPLQTPNPQFPETERDPEYMVCLSKNNNNNSQGQTASSDVSVTILQFKQW